MIHKKSAIFFLSFIIFNSCFKDKRSSVNSKKPNIIFILIDDLGYGDVGFNGSTYYETPKIDALANEGLVFDNAYMYPTCSPSRTALFTGKQSFRTGVYTVPVLEEGTNNENIFSHWTVGRQHKGYSELLSESGYKMIHIGKWHLVGPYPTEELAMDWPIKEGLNQPKPWDFSWVEQHRSEAVKQYYPEGRGFLKNIGGTYRGDPALEVGGYNSETGGYFAPFSNPFLIKKPNDEWLTDRLTDEAIEFMDEYKETSFFINLHYYTVHRPLRSRSDKLFKKYMNKKGDTILGQGLELGEKKKYVARYATMIESLDDNIGRIVRFLENNQLREDTIIIFTSDNGHNNTSNNRLRGSKGMVYEGGIKVPMFVNWPSNINKGRTNTPIEATDYFPTFMDLADIDYKGVLDGKSFTSLFDGKTDEDLLDRPLFWHIASQYKHGTCSVIRKNNYKLIQFLKDGSVELYNLEDDPMESIDLSETKIEIKEELLNELVGWRKNNKVPLPPNSILKN
ncbi:sulfatase [Sabulilitoribacter arenilitoris]|uniref:Sulfatase n=1 Tax=Wocania arenilitoris TaxID=2044858 RepID=A0AAE3ELE0_9FLAO|nr:sulfatase [Wocania arenilitoris]MCF7567056.1 sulfatase [Wocania arenilitoris]